MKEHKDAVNFGSTIFNQADLDRAALLEMIDSTADETISELVEIARVLSTMDCFYSGSTCAPNCQCIVARAERAIGLPDEPVAPPSGEVEERVCASYEEGE